MFDRVLYKKTARQQLKGRWGFPVLLGIVTGILAALVGGGSQTADSSLSLLFLLIELGVTGALLIATCYVYLHMAQTTRKADFSLFFAGLEGWLQGALGMMWYWLWVFLWSLLFVIPGIIKALSYSQMFYILAENPAVGVRKAMRMSKVITQGYKGDLFVMGLSFFGWGFLCVLSCGIGFLWLFPYINMSAANTYAALKNMAIMTNKITPADFAPAEDTQGDVQ